MRLFRSVLLCRLVAAALAVALGLPLAPSASASPALAVLDDSAAFDLALDAARSAAPGADAVQAFAEAYADAVDGVSAEAVAHLLGAPSMSGVVPVAPAEALAKAHPAPTPSPAAASAAVETRAPDSGEAAPAAVTVDLPTAPRAPSLRPRAP